MRRVSTGRKKFATCFEMDFGCFLSYQNSDVFKISFNHLLLRLDILVQNSFGLVPLAALKVAFTEGLHATLFSPALIFVSASSTRPKGSISRKRSD